MNLRISVGGDAEGGWLVDIHDGETNSVHRPSGATAIEAARYALDDYQSGREPDGEAHVSQADQLKAEVQRLSDKNAALKDARDKAVAEAEQTRTLAVDQLDALRKERDAALEEVEKLSKPAEAVSDPANDAPPVPQPNPEPPLAA